MFFIMAGGFYIAAILIRDGTAKFDEAFGGFRPENSSNGPCSKPFRLGFERETVAKPACKAM